jgi:hypothetical protein
MKRKKHCNHQFVAPSISSSVSQYIVAMRIGDGGAWQFRVGHVEMLNFNVPRLTIRTCSENLTFGIDGGYQIGFTDGFTVGRASVAMDHWVGAVDTWVVLDLRQLHSRSRCLWDGPRAG